VVHGFEQLRLDQKYVGDAFRFNRRERLSGIVPGLEYDRTAANERRVDEYLRQITRIANPSSRR
jgi:hypothetical protein